MTKKMSLKQKLNLARQGKLPQPEVKPAIRPKEPVPVYHIRARFHDREDGNEQK